MKISILFSLLILFLFSTCQTINSRPDFHLKVELLDNNIPGGLYEIEFTNNNWTTTEYIMDTRDLSDEDVGNWVPFIKKMFMFENACKEAIEFAKQFDTYEKAHQYNQKMEKLYNNLINYRNEHPIKKRVVQTQKPPCETTQLY